MWTPNLFTWRPLPRASTAITDVTCIFSVLHMPAIIKAKLKKPSLPQAKPSFSRFLKILLLFTALGRIVRAARSQPKVGDEWRNNSMDHLLYLCYERVSGCSPCSCIALQHKGVPWPDESTVDDRQGLCALPRKQAGVSYVRRRNESKCSLTICSLLTDITTGQPTVGRHSAPGVYMKFLLYMNDMRESTPAGYL